MGRFLVVRECVRCGCGSLFSSFVVKKKEYYDSLNLDLDPSLHHHHSFSVYHDDDVDDVWKISDL